MNDYKRFVSYIYNYELKVKKNNVGYARVEIKENQCKITIHMQVKSIVNGKLNIYGFLRDDLDLLAIPFGEFTLKNGSGESQIFLKANEIGEARHDFSEICGIIVYISQDKYFGTEWDDKPLIFNELRVEEIEEEKEVLVETAEIRYKERTPEAAVVEQPEPVIPCEPDVPDNNVINSEIILFECNPYFQAYSLNDLYDRFAYSVKDDFMLHGYHRFGHLGVLEKNNRVILGVPGIFCRREEQIANNSGFHNFISKGGKTLQYGDFGYWYSSTEYLK